MTRKACDAKKENFLFKEREQREAPQARGPKARPWLGKGNWGSSKEEVRFPRFF